MSQKNRLVVVLSALFAESLLFASLFNPEIADWLSSKTTLALIFIQYALILSMLSTLLYLIYFLIESLPSRRKKSPIRRETRISEIYAKESLQEGKSRRQIITDLEQRGYRKDEIEAFLKEWERREDRISTGHS